MKDFTATLVPRRFLIQHQVNDYWYHVVWQPCRKGWQIQLGEHGVFMEGPHKLVDALSTELLFSTPEEALEAWVGWMRHRYETKES